MRCRHDRRARPCSCELKDLLSAIKPASPKPKWTFGHRKGGDSKLPAGLKNDFQVLSAYGFKIVTITDKTGKQRQVWAAASEADFRKAESIRLKIKPEEVKVSRSSTMAYIGPSERRILVIRHRILHLGLLLEGNYYYCTCT